MKKKKYKIKDDQISGGVTHHEWKLLRESDLDLKCSDCNKLKPAKNFTSRAVNGVKGKYLYIEKNCNECNYIVRKKKYEHRKKEYSKTQYNKQYNTIDGRASLLVYRCRQRAKRCGIDCQLDIDNIHEKLLKGVCEVTGVILEFSQGDYNPYSPSIDRIDSGKGYVDGNIQVVCMIYNFMKNKFTTKQVLEFIEKIKINKN